MTGERAAARRTAIGCEITRICWERVNLSLQVTLTGQTHDQDVRFTIADKEREYPLRAVGISNHLHQIRMNITNFQDRAQVPDGTWRFVPHIGGVPQQPATFDLKRLADLDDDSRTFVYAGNRVCYLVIFGISEDAERPELLMRTYQMFRNPKPAKGTPKPPLADRLRRRALPRSRRIRLINRWYQLARLTRPRHRQRILFASEMRPRMDGNLLRIHERIYDRGLDRRFDVRTSFRAPHSGTRWGTMRVIYLIATSDIVLIDDYFALLESLRLSPHTKIIQAWHAGSGFKNIGYSRFGNYGSPKLRNAHRKYTYAITGSRQLVPVYAEAFGIEESAIVPTGLPRIDTFLDPVNTDLAVTKFFEQHPCLRGRRIILFAPTFRGRGTSTAYYDYGRLDFAKLYEACGDDTVMLFRMHHYVTEPVPIPEQFRHRLNDFSRSRVPTISCT